ncbi:hypothetical protein E2L08_04260 [Palleronia sediminis]|uniref:YtxH-like protein n=1 Tax=Palleronia sediminis TaxID=2547833 RepID=A0A4R6AK79_9RHOB|nr:hypothetical protein [Palleronia sediminis]TDL81873.1 hypothetical protein E2L08_04260 [Palleronia sediminis]
MTPFARNAAIAAAAVLVPAAAAAAIAYAPERSRSLPARWGDRLRDLLHDEPDTNLDRITARLDALAHRIEAAGHGAYSRAETAYARAGDTSTATRILAGVGIMTIVPIALTAIFAPDRAADLRDRVTDRLRGGRADEDDDAMGQQIDDELDALNERLSGLSEDLDRQRDMNFAAVTRTARNDH